MSTADNELDRLADALQRESGIASVRDGAGARLDAWLRIVADRAASDLILLAGEPPTLRIDGQIVRTTGAEIDGVDIEHMVLSELPPHAQRAYREIAIADASYKVPGVVRF